METTSTTTHNGETLTAFINNHAIDSDGERYIDYSIWSEGRLLDQDRSEVEDGDADQADAQHYLDAFIERAEHDIA